MFKRTQILTAAVALGFGMSACAGLIDDLKAKAEQVAFEAFVDEGFGDAMGKNVGAVDDAVKEAEKADTSPTDNTDTAPAFAALAVSTETITLNFKKEKDGNTVSVKGTVTKSYDLETQAGSLALDGVTVEWNAQAAGFSTTGNQTIDGSIPFGTTAEGALTSTGTITFEEKEHTFDVTITFSACDAATLTGTVDTKKVNETLDLSDGEDCSIVDSDDDGVADGADAFPYDVSESVDADADGVGDNGDNCVNTANPEQYDTNTDGEGDACDDSDADGEFDDVDTDDDGDSFSDQCEIDAGTDDFDPNSIPDAATTATTESCYAE